MELAIAQGMAKHVAAMLHPASVEIVVAGSIRRRKPMVKDIELVAIPAIERVASKTLLGEETVTEVNQLHVLLDELIVQGKIHRDPNLNRWGERYRRFLFTLADVTMAVDCFIVLPPAQFPVLLAIRTGSADFNKHCFRVASRHRYRVADGQLWNVLPGEFARVELASEREYLERIGLGWVEPADRS